MKTKVNKLVKITVTGLFLIALVINIKVTLDDPFVMLSKDAIAQSSSASTSSSSSSSGKVRTDGDCVYVFEGQVGAEIKIAGIKIGEIGADGTFKYTYGSGKTNCETGGNQDCRDRYCPPLF